MSDKKLEDKIIKLDPLAKALDDVGMKGGVGRLPKSYAKFYLNKLNLKLKKPLVKKITNLVLVV